LTDVNRWDEKAGLRRDAVRSQVIDALEAQEIQGDRIFKKETGQDIEEYANKYLFQPLEMEHYWKRTPLGIVDSEGGLFLRSGDLAKIGYLYLNNGMWNSKRLVSADWVKQSLTPQIDTGDGMKYG